MRVRTKKKKRRVMRGVLLAIAGLLLAAIAACLVSPLPMAYLIRAAFNTSPAVEPEGYQAMCEQVLVTHDAAYPSQFQNNLADVYVPKTGDGPFPVVLWVHGGAFVGGQKSDVAFFATALAAQGVAVVCMGYQRAPEAQYPTPVLQVGEAIAWLQSVANDYALDTTRLMLAGDSAGAHIVSQFAAVQTSPAYAQMMRMTPSLAPDVIKAVLLYCGPFDAAGIAQSDSALMNFVLGRAAWAYFGTGDWATRFAQEATVANGVTADFPPAFITDGNKLSFETHGRALADVLRQHGVPVETYFVPIEDEEAIHEYQFMMNTPAAQEAFTRTLAFIRAQTP